MSPVDRSIRAQFDTGTRVSLLEGDVTMIEQTMKELTEKQETNNKLLMGILVTLATSCILLAINVIFLS